jgi:holo-[acyl-carrier protein] synthase
MILGIGTDLVMLEEFSASVDAQPGRYCERIFTSQELAYAQAGANPYQRLAARLAAKESFMKAIGTGWTDDVDWLHIEILVEESGRPYIRLSESTQQLAEARGITEIHLSMSHTALLASAVVVLEGAARPKGTPSQS